MNSEILDMTGDKKKAKSLKENYIYILIYIERHNIHNKIDNTKRWMWLNEVHRLSVVGDIACLANEWMGVPAKRMKSSLCLDFNIFAFYMQVSLVFHFMRNVTTKKEHHSFSMYSMC